MKTFSPSATVSINDLAQQKIKNGERIFNFAAGDPILPTHPEIAKAAILSIQSGKAPYPPVEGIPELREATIDWLNREYGTHFSKKNMIVTSGGKFGIFASLFTLLENGDEVIICAPYWVSYPEVIKMAGGIPKIVFANPHDWKISPKDLEASITKNTKFFIFNNACNPTGSLYSRDEIEIILEICRKRQVRVISDEVYSGLVFEGEFTSAGAFLSHQENVIIVQSCSKNFGMAGWRIGFVAAEEKIIKSIAAMQSQSITSTALASQWAAFGAINKYREVNLYVKKVMQQRRDLFVNTYHQLFKTSLKIPSALYAFLPISNFSNQKDSIGFCQFLMTQGNIAAVPGIAFGIDGYVRFAYSGLEEEIVSGLKALAAVSFI